MDLVSQPDQFSCARRAGLFIVGRNDPILMRNRRPITPSHSRLVTLIMLIKDLPEPDDRGQWTQSGGGLLSVEVFEEPCYIFSSLLA